MDLNKSFYHHPELLSTTQKRQRSVETVIDSAKSAAHNDEPQFKKPRPTKSNESDAASDDGTEAYSYDEVDPDSDSDIEHQVKAYTDKEEMLSDLSAMIFAIKEKVLLERQLLQNCNLQLRHAEKAKEEADRAVHEAKQNKQEIESSLRLLERSVLEPLGTVQSLLQNESLEWLTRSAPGGP